MEVETEATLCRASKPRFSAAAVTAAVTSCIREEDLLVNAPSEILNGALFLGDCDNATNERQLRHFGITHILNATTNKHLGEHDGVAKLVLNLYDDENETIAATFSDACEFIHTAMAAGGCVLVHCMAGRSRSATLVLAYLMRVERMTLGDAFLLMKTKRPIIFPNVGFWKQLVEEELQLYGVASKTPSCYTQLFELQKGSVDISPSTLCKLYSTAFAFGDSMSAIEQRQRIVAKWQEGWQAAKSVNEMLRSSLDNLRSESRIATVHLISQLCQAGWLTVIEIREGFDLFLSTLDLDDERLDNPKIDIHVAEITREAEAFAFTRPTEPAEATEA